MSVIQDIMYVLGKMVTFEERLSQVNDRVVRLGEACENINERLARLEGKFELLEHLGTRRGRKLPSSS